MRRTPTWCASSPKDPSPGPGPEPKPKPKPKPAWGLGPSLIPQLDPSPWSRQVAYVVAVSTVLQNSSSNHKSNPDLRPRPSPSLNPHPHPNPNPNPNPNPSA